MNEMSGTVRVLAVSPNESDLLILSRIIDHSAWSFESASSLADAKQLLARFQTHVVVCDRKLRDGDWKDMLEIVSALPNPPQLIVVSKDADERLWAEVLNRGAWDVLLKPFHPKEVYQSIHLAWRHWLDGCRVRERIAAPKSGKAASSGTHVATA
jgi:DNA-binding response OmpR family regulator